MRRKADDQIQVAVLAAAHAGNALPLEANALAVAHAGRNFHVQRLAGLAYLPPQFVVHRQRVGNLAALTMQRFLEEQRHLHLQILAAEAMPAVRVRSRAMPARRPPAEHAFEEIGEVLRVGAAAVP